MSWRTAREHIAAHCRGGKWDRLKSRAENISDHSLLCVAGMLETGEVTLRDIEAVGGNELRAAVRRVIVEAGGDWVSAFNRGG